MERDMDLIRLILLEIEKEYRSTPLYGLKVEGYDMETIAYQCELLYQHGLISDYGSQYGDDTITDFAVGHLTWEGHDYLDKIRDNSRWGKIKKVLKEKALPPTIEVIKMLADGLISAATAAAVSSITGAK